MDVTWGARGQEAGLPMARVQPGVSRGRRRGAVPGGVRGQVHTHGDGGLSLELSAKFHKISLELPMQ